MLDPIVKNKEKQLQNMKWDQRKQGWHLSSLVIYSSLSYKLQSHWEKLHKTKKALQVFIAMEPKTRSHLSI